MPHATPYLKSVLVGFLIGCLVFLIILVVQLGAPTRRTTWADEIYRHKTEWANSISEEKLVIVGGSSALFGISCKQIHRTFKVPCVNGGTHAGLGVGYVLHRARQFVNPGDTVLLALAYEFYSTNQSTPPDFLVDYVLSRDPHFLIEQNFGSSLQIILGVSWYRLLSGFINAFVSPNDYGISYKAKTLNRFGDETANRLKDLGKGQKQARNSLTPYQARGYVSESYGMEQIQKFIAYCKENNITVLATWPNTLWFEEYESGEYKSFFESINNFYQNLDIPLLGQYREFMYDKAQIFDTIYHLNRSGVRLRTKQLEEYLNQYL